MCCCTARVEGRTAIDGGRYPSSMHSSFPRGCGLRARMQFNKFSVVPHHFMLVTKGMHSPSNACLARANRLQSSGRRRHRSSPRTSCRHISSSSRRRRRAGNSSHSTTVRPLEIAHILCPFLVHPWDGHVGGDLSGASQPHKHIQLLPIDDDGPPVEKLARDTKLDQDSTLFLHPHPSSSCPTDPLKPFFVYTRPPV